MEMLTGSIISWSNWISDEENVVAIGEEKKAKAE
ncbi:hypothetical protein J2T13_002242 [Paenibacillus sp. DS2015]